MCGNLWDHIGSWILKFCFCRILGVLDPAILIFCTGSSGILDSELFLHGVLDPEVMILHVILGILDPKVLVFAWDLGDLGS